MISDIVFNAHKAFMSHAAAGVRGNISYGNYSGESYIDRRFSGMIIEHSVFQFTDFTLSSFRDTEIKNCDFSGSNFSMCDLNCCRFENCIFDLCCFKSADLTNAVFTGCTIKRCVFDNAKMAWVQMDLPIDRYSTFKDAELSTTLEYYVKNRGAIV